MNKTFMNTVSLAKDPFIRKGEGGGGGGVTINNQEKSLEITENGVTEVKPDAGFTGLSKVIVNTNVASSGGGGSDMPVIGDGKTYLYITIAAEGRMNVPLYFSQTVANGVTIDWGDGSAPQTLSGTGKEYTTHKYAAIGDYVISLDPVDGCTLGLGDNSSSNCVMGRAGSSRSREYTCMLRHVEIGRNVPKIDSYAFQYCGLQSLVIQDGVTDIGSYAFQYSDLKSIVIPGSVKTIGDFVFGSCHWLHTAVLSEGVTVIGGYMFSGASSLTSLVVPGSVTSVGYNGLVNTYALRYCDFSQHIAVPPMENNAFNGTASDCKIIVPDALYGEWIAATNWSTASVANKIIKKSDWDASRS